MDVTRAHVDNMEHPFTIRNDLADDTFYNSSVCPIEGKQPYTKPLPHGRGTVRSTSRDIVLSNAPYIQTIDIYAVHI